MIGGGWWNMDYPQNILLILLIIYFYNSYFFYDPYFIYSIQLMDMVGDDLVCILTNRRFFK